MIPEKGDLMQIDDQDDGKHLVGNINCQGGSCGGSWPMECMCGGLIHCSSAENGGMFEKCDECASDYEEKYKQCQVCMQREKIPGAYKAFGCDDVVIFLCPSCFKLASGMGIDRKSYLVREFGKSAMYVFAWRFKDAWNQARRGPVKHGSGVSSYMQV